MNTARQATENMEYVRRLLEEKQAGFAASLELAVSFIERPIEQPEETMGLTLPSGRHETIEKQDPVHEWRVARSFAAMTARERARLIAMYGVIAGLHVAGFVILFVFVVRSHYQGSGWG